MSDSDSGITDSVEVEHTAAEALEELVAEQEVAVEEVEAIEEVDADQQRVVVDFEDAWTVQSSHGVYLGHFVPTQDYKAIEADENERQLEQGNDW
jgi:hypothetical protein